MNDGSKARTVGVFPGIWTQVPVIVNVGDSSPSSAGDSWMAKCSGGRLLEFSSRSVWSAGTGVTLERMARRISSFQLIGSCCKHKGQSIFINYRK